MKQLPFSSLLACWVGLMLLPSTAWADEPIPDPSVPALDTLTTEVELPPEHGSSNVRTRANWPVMIPGLATFGVSWIVNGLVSQAPGRCPQEDVPGLTRPWCEEDPSWGDFRIFGAIPLAGPFMQLAAIPDGQADAWPYWLVIDGVAQLAGATLFIVGLLTPEEVSDPNAPSLTVVPTLGPGQVGLTASGVF